MKKSNFLDKLTKVSQINKSFLCVGLDPDLEQISSKFKTTKYPLFDFNRYIIDQTHDLACAFKPNSAFYENFGHKGILELEKTCQYIQDKYPQIPLILDFKRGDIGNTNTFYARFAFDKLKVDAVTINPLLGTDSITEFTAYREKFVFILCKTSNPSAGEFQDLKIGNKPLYEIIARKVKNDWNQKGNCGLVVGATYPEQLKSIRKIVGDMNLLIPGIGSQKGDLEQTMRFGLNSDKAGVIINVARKIIFDINPRQSAIAYRDQINQYLK